MATIEPSSTAPTARFDSSLADSAAVRSTLIDVASDDAAEEPAPPGSSPLAQCPGRSVAHNATAPATPNGARRRADGAEYVFYDGYWVRYYAPKDDSLATRKRLIDSLTKRAFHHTEPGINTPGERLEAARAAWQHETDPARKRVNAAMLAGALFNRATDIFTAIVELEQKGVKISRGNELMKACGDCFKEALELGKSVRHHSGEEGIDELWGEPFRAFTLPASTYYESRLIKLSQTMANIDDVARQLQDTFGVKPEFEALAPLVDALACAARHECETMKSDACIFEIWPRFVAAGEAVGEFRPPQDAERSNECQHVFDEAMRTITAGRDLINWIARARVPMPRSTRDFHERCEALKLRLENC